jgi:hypothetical protein
VAVGVKSRKSRDARVTFAVRVWTIQLSNNIDPQADASVTLTWPTQRKSPVENLDPKAVMRMVALFIHVVALAFAAAGVALGDYGLMGGRHLSRTMLRKGAQWVLVALGMLWGSGFVLVGIDTGFDPVLIGRNSKLLAKLSVVTLLSINGWALHRYALPLLLGRRQKPLGPLPVLLGAISAASWLFAMFVGISKAVAPALGYWGYMALYAFAVLTACIVALGWMRPVVQRQYLALHQALRKQASAEKARTKTERRRAEGDSERASGTRATEPSLRVVR